MSETTPPAGARGAVDLSSVAGMTAPTAATAGAGMPAGAVPGQQADRRPVVPGGLVVEVDAQNLMGATVRQVYSCEAKATGDGSYTPIRVVVGSR